MYRSILPLLLLPFLFNPASVPAAATTPIPHCQVPCGIYGDSMRIAMMMEDATTIEKGMKTILEMEKSGEFPHNQMVRWIMTKDDHAAKIQEQVASYWLAQRIKVPTDDAAKAKYHQQLSLLHGITVAAMKCKQTTDTAHVEALRKHAMDFSETYFSAEDLEHLRDHHGEEKK
jgi:nickel superoxide dismutase